MVNFEEIVDRCLKRAIAEDLWKHKCLGQSVIMSKNGIPLEVLPEEIEVPMEYL